MDKKKPNTIQSCFKTFEKNKLLILDAYVYILIFDLDLLYIILCLIFLTLTMSMYPCQC